MNHLSKRTWKTACTCLLLAGLTLTGGCITTAVVLTVTALSADGEDGASVATVQLDRSPDDIYSAALKLAEARPDVLITDRNPAKFRLDVQRGDQIATIRAAAVGGGRSELTVLAQSEGEDTVPEDLALSIVEGICKELGVKYDIVE